MEAVKVKTPSKDREGVVPSASVVKKGFIVSNEPKKVIIQMNHKQGNHHFQDWNMIKVKKILQFPYAQNYLLFQNQMF